MSPEVWQSLWGHFLLFLPRLLTSLIIVLFSWILAVAAQRLAGRLAANRRLDHDLTLFLGLAAKISLLVFGGVTALGTLGVDVTALVAGVGLTGFALGFALKDIISNALSGILVLMYHPFRKGDRITVTALEGTVLEINLRYTVLDAEGKFIFIPNANLVTNPVTVTKRAEVAGGP